jgi:hypothetical protein
MNFNKVLSYSVNHMKKEGVEQQQKFDKYMSQQ